jgi:hypothetical protein
VLSLGNLANTRADDDGGNVFEPDTRWAVQNQSPRLVRAEGNDFGTHVAAEIDRRIYDKLDDPQWGRVDYDPVAGGGHPTSVRLEAALAVSGLAAIPARTGGAEVVFALSSPASVSLQVVNLAGRPVAAPVRSVQLAAGLQRLTWNGTTEAGLPAPAGRYLLRITARGDNGLEAQAVCSVVRR